MRVSVSSRASALIRSATPVLYLGGSVTTPHDTLMPRYAVRQQS